MDEIKKIHSDLAGLDKFFIIVLYGCDITSCSACYCICVEGSGKNKLSNMECKSRELETLYLQTLEISAWKCVHNLQELEMRSALCLGLKPFMALQVTSPILSLAWSDRNDCHRL